MSDTNPLAGEPLNVVVAGRGGIATALMEKLLADYPVQHLFCLARGEPDLSDERLHHVAMDATDEHAIAEAGQAVGDAVDEVHLVVNAVGMLHDATFKPEKRLKDVSVQALHQLMTVNAYLLPQLAAALSPLLRHGHSSVLASLSARVGSIGDNAMGGWYSYRASKAAHNQLLRTLACEWRVSHKHCCVIALHPGTVATPLSKPYTPANYSKRVLSPGECAEALLQVIGNLDAKSSGGFKAWDGEDIPW